MIHFFLNDAPLIELPEQKCETLDAKWRDFIVPQPPQSRIRARGGSLVRGGSAASRRSNLDEMKNNRSHSQFRSPIGFAYGLFSSRVSYLASKSPRVTQPYVQSRASTRVWPIMCVQTCALASMSIWRVSSRVSNLAYQIVCPYTYTCAQSCAQSCVASTLVCSNTCTLICVYVH